VIHVKMDSPGAGLYGVSPTSKAHVPIMTWLYAAGLVKETMRKGDPPRTHVDWPLALAEPDRKRASAQYSIRNLGAKNIGNLFETRGGATVKEMSQNKIEYWLAVMVEARDEILSTYGVPPAKVGVIEAGNLGGGTGVTQDRTFLVNTCGPVEELALEKFTFSLCYQAFGLTDWRIKFTEVDWRDELIVEQIRDLRLRNGTWSNNRYRKDINEPPTDGGDKPVLVDRQNLVLWQDLAALSAATVDARKTPTPFGGKPPVNPPASTEDDDDEPFGIESLSSIWRRDYQARVRNALKEFSSGIHD